MTEFFKTLYGKIYFLIELETGWVCDLSVIRLVAVRFNAR